MESASGTKPASKGMAKGGRGAGESSNLSVAPIRRSIPADQLGGERRLGDDARVAEGAHLTRRRVLGVEVEEGLDVEQHVGDLAELGAVAEEQARRVDGERVGIGDVALVGEVVADLGGQLVHLRLVEEAAVADLAAAGELLAGELVGAQARREVGRVVLGEEAVVAQLEQPVLGGLDVLPLDLRRADRPVRVQVDGDEDVGAGVGAGGLEAELVLARLAREIGAGREAVERELPEVKMRPAWEVAFHSTSFTASGLAYSNFGGV
jgi:hypothetical protein